MLISIVTPAYNEAQNLPVLYGRLCAAMDSLGVQWEWIVVDDSSPDATFEVITGLAESDSRVRGIRFARNFGAHTALACGLHHASGEVVAAIAADLQDPPEVIPQLFAQWRNGAKVVWAARHERKGESQATLGMARLYYLLMRNVVGLKQIPETGADFFLLDRQVVEAFARFGEANVSVLALFAWMGFRQETILYDKDARLHGRSGWTLRKKLKLLVDSVTAFSYTPIRAMSYVGFVVALLGFVYAGVVIFNAFNGQPAEGWSSLMVIVLVLAGIQMLMMGVLGEYVWRALDEARRRPRYIIESETTPSTAARTSSSAAGLARLDDRRGASAPHGHAAKGVPDRVRQD